jgi:type II secretory pathway component PulF
MSHALSYRYRAARPDGAIVAGVLDAASQDDASGILAERGLFPVALHPVETDARRSAASRQDLAIVFRSLATLVGAGVPLERAVAATEPLVRGRLREVLSGTRTALREGKSLAQALALGLGVVPAVALGMVRAGERSSQLPAALEQVASHLEQEAELVARVRQALAYPMLLAVAGTASVLVIGTVVVPRFAELLGDLGQSVPLATRLLLSGSAVLARFWMPLLAIVMLVIWAAVEWWRRPAGRQRVDETLLSLPMIGPLRQALATARVARALGGMLRAGMPLLPALEAARDAAGDAAVAARLSRTWERVAQGAPLAASLEHEDALSRHALPLFVVGESSGQLGDMSLRAGDLAAREAERGLKTLVTILEPALILAFGGLVAFVAAALLQAVYSLRPGGP